MAVDRQEVGRKKLEADARKLRALFPQTVWLAAPLTSTSFDGDSFSDVANTLIDLSAVFGVPAGIRAVYLYVEVNDSGSAGVTNQAFVEFKPAAAAAGIGVSAAGLANDARSRGTPWVPCNEDGDIWYSVNATGASTLDMTIEVWGYMI